MNERTGGVRYFRYRQTEYIRTAPAYSFLPRTNAPIPFMAWNWSCLPLGRPADRPPKSVTRSTSERHRHRRRGRDVAFRHHAQGTPVSLTFFCESYSKICACLTEYANLLSTVYMYATRNCLTLLARSVCLSSSLPPHAVATTTICTTCRSRTSFDRSFQWGRNPFRAPPGSDRPAGVATSRQASGCLWAPERNNSSPCIT